MLDIRERFVHPKLGLRAVLGMLGVFLVCACGVEPQEERGIGGTAETKSANGETVSTATKTVPAAGKAALEEAAASRRVALVVANAAYSNAPLGTPVSEAKQIAETLKGCGFDVIEKTDCNLRTMKETVNAFGARIRGAAVALFYFAGHGLQANGCNYLVPIGAELAGPGDVEHECLDTGRVLAKMEDAGTQANIVILDACRNNPLTRSWRRSSTQGLASMDAPTGSIIAFATAPGSVAIDGVYTPALLETLRTPGLPIEQVFLRAHGVVQRKTNKAQVPWLNMSHPGGLVLLPAEEGRTRTRADTNAAVDPPADLLNPVPSAEGVSESGVPIDDNVRGVEAYKEKRFAEAAKYFEAAMASAPKNAIVRRNLLNSLQSQADELARAGRFMDASSILERAVEIDPEHVSMRLQLGVYLLRQSDVRGAIQQLETAIELVPQNRDGHELLGDAYYRDNDLEAAAEQWEWVLQVDPTRSGLKEKLDRVNRELMLYARTRSISTDHFHVTCSAEIPEKALDTLAGVIEEVYESSAEKIHRVYLHAPAQVYACSPEEMTRICGLGADFGAVYDGKLRIAVVDRRGAPHSEEELRARFASVYGYALVRQLCDDRAPWWIMEGVSRVLSRQGAPWKNDPKRLAAARNQPRSLANLVADPTGEYSKQALSRDEFNSLGDLSALAVDHLLKSSEPIALRGMLTDIGAGKSLEDALKARYDMTLQQLEAQIRGTEGR